MTLHKRFVSQSLRLSRPQAVPTEQGSVPDSPSVTENTKSCTRRRGLSRQVWASSSGLPGSPGGTRSATGVLEGAAVSPSPPRAAHSPPPPVTRPAGPCHGHPWVCSPGNADVREQLTVPRSRCWKVLRRMLPLSHHTQNTHNTSSTQETQHTRMLHTTQNTHTTYTQHAHTRHVHNADTTHSTHHTHATCITQIHTHTQRAHTRTRTHTAPERASAAPSSAWYVLFFDVFCSVPSFYSSTTAGCDR